MYHAFPHVSISDVGLRRIIGVDVLARGCTKMEGAAVPSMPTASRVYYKNKMRKEP